jgi:hypothetical protein
MFYKRGAGELVPLPGFLAGAEPKVFVRAFNGTRQL